MPASLPLELSTAAGAGAGAMAAEAWARGVDTAGEQDRADLVLADADAVVLVEDLGDPAESHVGLDIETADGVGVDRMVRVWWHGWRVGVPSLEYRV